MKLNLGLSGSVSPHKAANEARSEAIEQHFSAQGHE
jgi:hypothetical protein